MTIDMRNVVLQSCFNSRLSGFNFAHLNPGSLVANFTEFSFIVKNVPLHLIAISETWLKAKHKDILCQLDGYNLIRKDRINAANRRGGGVALYINNIFNYKVIKKNALESSFDYLFIEISNTKNEKLLVGVIYRPPRINFLGKLKKFLIESASKYNNMLILGDLNLEVNANTRNVRTFKDFISSIDLEIASYCPTNFSDNCATCLDLLLLNNRSNLKFFTQISVPGLFTTHDMIFGSYNFDVNICRDDAIVYRRSVSNIDQRVLLAEGSLLNWNKILFLSDPNDQVDHLNSLVVRLLDKFAPLRKVNSKPPNDSFTLSDSILQYRNIRDFLHGIWKTNKNSVAFNHYKKYRNMVNNLIRAAKLKFFKRNIFNLDLPNNVLWRNFQKYGLSKSKDTVISGFSVTEFSNHFSAGFRTPVSNPQYVNSSISSIDNRFYFDNVSSFDVCKAIGDIDSDSVGSDGIPISFIKLLLPLICHVLTHIVNTALTKSIFPNAWKTAHVIPVAKVPKPESLKDYRPISLIPCLSKVLEKLMKSQMLSHISGLNLICNLQSGFRDRHSTTSALIKIIDDLSLSVAEGKIPLLVLLDFSKAFDSVDHKILLNKLQTYFHFSNSAVKLLASYIGNRFQIVKLNNELSNACPLVSGVPQGSILGPILFSMFINDIANSINSVNFHIFADDLQIYDSDLPSNMEVCVQRINDNLRSILTWSQNNHIAINPAKSKAMFLSTNNTVLSGLSNFRIVIDNVSVEIVDKVRNLGLIMNSKLNWDDHVNHLCCKIFATLRALWTHESYTPRDAKLKLVRSLIVPHLLYCAPIYSGCSNTTFRKLNTAFNSCARYIYNKRKSDSISHYARSILDCDLYDYLEFSTVVFLYKLISNKSPEYLFELVKFFRSPRSRNICLPTICKSKARQSSFFVRSIKLWNSLNPNLQSIDSLSRFKNECFIHFSSH